jgi:hypothetical protein
MTTVHTDRSGAVQVLAHANGTFDVCYNKPTVYHPGWESLVVAILRGVVASVINKNGTLEDVCHYRDTADYTRAITFLKQMTAEFPELDVLCKAEYVEVSPDDNNPADTTDHHDLIVSILYKMVDERREKFSNAFQTILLSSSVVTGIGDSTRGLITVTAAFCEEVLKVRLTGKITKNIAGILKSPYNIVKDGIIREMDKSQMDSSKKVREPRQVRESSNTANNIAQVQSPQIKSDYRTDLIRIRDQVNAIISKLEEGQQYQEQSHAADFRQSVKKTHETDVARNQNNQERRKKEVREYQKKVESISTETQQQQPEQKTYTRGQTPSIVYLDDAGHAANTDATGRAMARSIIEGAALRRTTKSPAQTVTPVNVEMNRVQKEDNELGHQCGLHLVDAVVEHQHSNDGTAGNTMTVVAENGHFEEIQVKPKRAKTDVVKSAFADKLSAALKQTTQEV